MWNSCFRSCGDHENDNLPVLVIYLAIHTHEEHFIMNYTCDYIVSSNKTQKHNMLSHQTNKKACVCVCVCVCIHSCHSIKLKTIVKGTKEQIWYTIKDFLILSQRSLAYNYKKGLTKLKISMHHIPSFTTFAWKILNISSKQCASIAAYVFCSSVRGRRDQSLHWSS